MLVKIKNRDFFSIFLLGVAIEPISKDLSEGSIAESGFSNNEIIISTKKSSMNQFIEHLVGTCRFWPTFAKSLHLRISTTTMINRSSWEMPIII